MTSKNKIRLVAYLRVSGVAQLDGYGLEIQKADITTAAAAMDAEIVRWCSDEGRSGTIDAVDREGLACAIEAIRQDEADGLIVANLTRLARALTVQEAALALVWKAGGRVFTADTGEVPMDDPDDPMRTAIRQIMGVMAQLDRATIALRLKKGRAAKAEAGGYAFGSPKFGRKAEEGELVENAAETEVIKLARQMQAEGKSLRQIAAKLNEAGTRTKRGTVWYAATVKRVLAA